MHLIQQPTIFSQRLGISAYKNAQKRHPAREKTDPANYATDDPVQGNLSREPSKRAKKELKFSVLSSLQSQSNSGLVNIRDVAAALDRILKKT